MEREQTGKNWARSRHSAWGPGVGQFRTSREWGVIWGKGSRNAIQGLGPASDEKADWEGGASVAKPQGIRIMPTGFPSDSAGCISVSIVLVVLVDEWMYGRINGLAGGMTILLAPPPKLEPRSFIQSNGEEG